MNSPVGRGVVAGGDQNGVPLGNRDRDEIRDILLSVSLGTKKGILSTGSHATNKKSRTYTVSFDDAHLVAVNPEEEHGERGGVDDAQTVGLARLHDVCQHQRTGIYAREGYLEGEGGILVEADRGGDGVRVRAGDGSEVLASLCKVHQAGVY